MAKSKKGLPSAAQLTANTWGQIEKEVDFDQSVPGFWNKLSSYRPSDLEAMYRYLGERLKGSLQSIHDIRELAEFTEAQFSTPVQVDLQDEWRNVWVFSRRKHVVQVALDHLCCRGEIPRFDDLGPKARHSLLWRLSSESRATLFERMREIGLVDNANRWRSYSTDLAYLCLQLQNRGILTLFAESDFALVARESFRMANPPRALKETWSAERNRTRPLKQKAARDRRIQIDTLVQGLEPDP